MLRLVDIRRAHDRARRSDRPSRTECRRTSRTGTLRATKIRRADGRPVAELGELQRVVGTGAHAQAAAHAGRQEIASRAARPAGAALAPAAPSTAATKPASSPTPQAAAPRRARADVLQRLAARNRAAFGRRGGHGRRVADAASPSRSRMRCHASGRHDLAGALLEVASPSRSGRWRRASAC